MLAVAALLATLPAPAGAAEDATARAYRVVQSLTIDEGQTGSYTLACRGHDLVTDGVWLVDDVAANPQLDDAPYDLVTGVDVLEAESFAGGAYRFTVRNNAEGPAQVRIAVACLGARLGAHRLRVSERRTTSTTLEPGMGAPPAVRCPRGSIAIAHGFSVGAPLTSPRLTTSAPATAAARRIETAFSAGDAATVRASARCLARRTTAAGGHRHRLRTTFRVGTTDVADGRVETFTVSCHAGEHPLLGSFRLGGSWYLGQLPGGRQRSFKVQSPPDGRSADAALGLLCLRLRA